MKPILLLPICACLLFSRPGYAQQNANGQWSQEVLTNQNLFYEYFKNQDYASAQPYLRWMLDNAPTYRGDTNWERAMELYEGLAGKAEDKAVRKALLDTALAVIDHVVPTMRKAGAEVDEYAWVIWRGRFISSYPEEYADRQEEVLTSYLKAFELDPKRTDPYYVQYIIDAYVRDNRKDEAVAFMDRVEQAFSGNAELITWLDGVRAGLFTSPAERMAFLETQLQKTPGDIEIMSELFNLYAKLGEQQKMTQMGKQLVKMEPDARIYRMLATMEHENGKAAEALRYYQQALELTKDDRTKRDLFFNMGAIYLDQGRLQGAWNSAKNALALDPKFGPAYMLLGDVIVHQVSTAGGKTRKDFAVYWLALDYYQRAKQVDPQVAGAANSKIATYSRFTPKQDDLFFEQWQRGDRYQINYGPYAWINETTTIR